MTVQNCWEVKKCGREPNGVSASEFGICPAAIKTNANGMNNGKNAGRVCWAIAGTFCGGKIQGSFASKLANCLDCEFHELVQAEEGENLASTMAILKLI